MKNEKIVYYLQGGLMILIFISPFLFRQYHLPFSNFGIYEVLAIILGFLGIALSVATMRAMGESFETKPRPKENGELITKFPFNYSRNPMYVSGFLLTLSWSFGHKSLITLLLALVLQIVLIFKVKIEEELLSEKFKEAYVKYKQNTPRWLILKSQ